MTRRVFGDEDRAAGLAVLVACGGVFRDAARKSGYPVNALRRWYSEGGDVVETLATQKTDDLAARFENIASRCVGLQGSALEYIENQPDPEERGKLALAHLPDLNRVGGTAVDKMRLLRGQSTEITDVGFFFPGDPFAGEWTDASSDDHTNGAS